MRRRVESPYETMKVTFTSQQAIRNDCGDYPLAEALSAA